jgi:hypothetical protein
MAPHTRPLAFVSALAVAVALAAAPASAAPSSDTKTAKAGVIVTGDVPSSWQSTPADDSSDKELERAARKIPDCKGYLAVRKTLDQAANAKSRDFAAGDESLSNEVWVFPSTTKAKKAFAAMSDRSIEDCLTTLFQDQFERLTSSDPTVRELRVVIAQTTDLPAVGDDIVGYGGGAEMGLANGTFQRLPVSNAVVRVGRSIISYTFSGGPTATGAYTQSFLDGIDRALEATVSRMKDAL